MAVLTAALKLFSEGGWTGTTIAAIARAAGVSKETIYGVWGTKSAVLAELLQRAIRGDDLETALLDQPGPLAAMRAPTAGAKITGFANDVAGILARVAPLVDVIRTSAADDPESATLYHDTHQARRRNLAVFVGALADDLRPGLLEAEATDQVWRLASPELYLLLTRQGGLDRAAYSRWLADALQRLLLGRRDD